MNMATRPANIEQGAAPVAPTLRIFDTIPCGHIAYAVPDDSCLPLATKGEVLVVTDEPRHYPDMLGGSWALIQWISDEEHCAAYNRDRVGQTVGIPFERNGLWGYRPPCNRSRRGVFYCGDTGYSYEAMTNRIRGRVVGIYSPGREAVQ